MHTHFRTPIFDSEWNFIESLFFATEAMTILQWGRISDRIGSVLKSVIGELTDSTNRADGFAYLAVVWSVGATIAPVIGGSLSHPHERLPAVVTSEFWREFPYFLPCLAVATFVLVCYIITLALFNELLTYPVVLSVCNYFCIALMEIAFISLLPLLMSTPVEFSDLGCSPAIIGYVLGALGAYVGVLVRRFGERRIFIMGVLTMAINSLLLPLISSITRKNGVTWVVWCLLAFVLALKAVLDMSFGCIFVYVNTSSPSKSSLGATNGVAQTMVSFARAIGPGLATSLFALSFEKNLLGGYAVYAVLFLFSWISPLFAVRLPPQLEVWDEKD
ncbi:Major facilitator superfamily domain containing protein [Amanita muscaria]